MIWKQPTKEDKANLFPASIIDCEIEGEWDVSKERSMTYTLRNHRYVAELVADISSASGISSVRANVTLLGISEYLSAIFT